MQQEELKRQKLDKLIQLLLEIPKSNVQSVAVFIENKMRMLKACYDKSEPHHKEMMCQLCLKNVLKLDYSKRYVRPLWIAKHYLIKASLKHNHLNAESLKFLKNQ